jgi:hypothetical protein
MFSCVATVAVGEDLKYFRLLLRAMVANVTENTGLIEIIPDIHFMIF